MLFFSVRQWLHDQIVANKYEGIEVNCANWLLRNAPTEYGDREELRAQVRFYAIESVELFKPELGAFCIFLKTHIRQRCLMLQRKMWLRSSGNEPCRMLQMSQHARDWSGLVNDPTQPIRMQEFLTALSEESRSAFDQLLACANQEKLCESFGSKRYRPRVLEMSGLTKVQVETLAAEIRRKMPGYL
jgi:hypothetical protein